MVKRVVSKEAKQAEIDQLVEDFKSSSAILVVDFLGLSVAEVTALRKELRDNDVKMKVVKNTLLRRAAAQAEIEGLDEYFSGPTAIVFSEDIVAPAKILTEQVKNLDALEIKGGMIEGKVASLADIETVAKLPSREGLLSMLLSVLQAPMRNTASVLSQASPARKMAYALKAVADSKDAA
ncbi:50S ribosomal protein L10 [Ignavigranum ruoffiae]|uniref:50S ribosomal protein L10 n=1 Tax=Ignavigranum ruoffiae TaxID=89093 RepID=UPI00204996DC|nr:50S ribosomal protein L10 [Ignavigranum ruoffiae]UPQ86353.1 50S ribosomal protein L10 [Ignavigranum ruoffiae]